MSGRNKRSQQSREERRDPDELNAPLLNGRGSQRDKNNRERENNGRSNNHSRGRDTGGRSQSNGHSNKPPKKRTSPKPQADQHPQRNSSKNNKRQSDLERLSAANDSLGKFIGRDLDTSASQGTSIANSQLTTPSAIRDEDDTTYNDDDDDGSYSTTSDYSTVSGSVERQSLISSRGGGKNAKSNRKQSNGGSTGKKRVGFIAGNGGTKVSRGTSALSMRKSGKRPWFKSSNSPSSKFSTGLANTTGPRNIASTTGVQYRSASSTQRALDEIKRKKLEQQEKKRAVIILTTLFGLAILVHFGGGSSSSSSSQGMGILNSLLGGKQVEGEVGLRGSKDKVYGTTKDLGYGGERSAVGGVPAATTADGGLAQGSDVATYGADGGEYGNDYEYKLPDPVVKEYDTEHEFLSPLKYFADATDPNRPSDTAYFFHVPRAGGSTIKSIIGKCLKLVQSSEVGVRDGHDQDPSLQVLDVQESSYVNVDTTNIPGLQRAVDLGLAGSGMADVIVSSYLHESAPLFDLTHQGRAFIVFRDPIERATSMYWHRIKNVGDLDDTTSIEDYAQGNGIENNWMCRFLANRMTGELTKDDLEQAKEILKTKFLVGFIDDLEESVTRIMKYNGWRYSEDETDAMREEDCIKDMVTSGSNVNEYEYEIPTRGSQAHALISWQTQFDSKLYAYAKEIFDHQTKEWGSKERKKELKKELKKKKEKKEAKGG